MRKVNKQTEQEFKKLIKKIEIVDKNTIVLFISTESKGGFFTLTDDFESFRKSYRDDFNQIAPSFTKQGWDKFREYLRELAIKGDITEDRYTLELACRILYSDSSLCRLETTITKIQSILDSKNIIVPAIVFKHIYAEWGYPDLKQREFEGGTLTDIIKGVKNGVLLC